VVFEFGVADPTVEAYALSHLPGDIDMAAVSDWALQARRVGGSGNERWVLSTYHVTGKLPDGKAIDQVMQETGDRAPRRRELPHRPPALVERQGMDPTDAARFALIA
jgi:hypothetical protein